ncbi:MAG: EAL domain-containing protein [Proteobacteria bacterium]|nr:EAL domain-containing protein [Pseudomonadota bacterium]
MVDKTQVTILVVENKENTSLWKSVQSLSFVHEKYKSTSIKDSIKTILEKNIDVIIAEFRTEDGDALEFLEAINALTAKIIPTIIIADKKDEKMGLQVFRKGARDFLVKDEYDQYLQRLPFTIERIVNEEIQYQEKNREKRNTEDLLAAISDGIIGLNLQDTITFANPAAALYFKAPLNSLGGKPLSDYAEQIDITFMDSLHKGMQQINATNQMTVIGQYMMHLSKNAHTSLVEANLIPVFNEMLHLEGYVLCFKDISETKLLNEELRNKSFQDDLTGLFNRKAFLNRLEHVIAYCKRYQKKCAVLFIDLDGFKVINDALGHLCGDEILLKVADRVQAVIRETDILARVGGDEFMVLLTHIAHPNDVAKVAAKINRTLLPAIELNNQKYFITASIGIALYPNDSSDPLKLVQYADFAMSLVKKRGKNHYQYYKSELNVEAEKMMRLANDLRFAVQSDQLDLYFHPQISAATGALMGLESLVRWHHPELGLISPAQFIPIAEEMGFIGNIGQWVLHKTCESYLAWKELGLENFSLSVNFSVNELQRDDFLEDIIQCMHKYEIDPHRFQFEITESIFAHDAKGIINKLLQLKQMGFQIAMDDFGTGYSCLSYLKDLPIDIIKIDRSFVQALSLHDNERHKAIIATIIDLAKRLHMTTLAEGVETQEQARYLTALGCEYLQGYLFAKPMPFEQATEYIQSRLSDISKGPHVYHSSGKTTH